MYQLSRDTTNVHQGNKRLIIRTSGLSIKDTPKSNCPSLTPFFGRGVRNHLPPLPEFRISNLFAISTQVCYTFSTQVFTRGYLEDSRSLNRDSPHLTLNHCFPVIWLSWIGKCPLHTSLALKSNNKQYNKNCGRFHCVITRIAIQFLSLISDHFKFTEFVKGNP